MAQLSDEPGFKDRFIARWEAKPARHQLGWAYLVGVVLLLILHLGGIATGIFPNLKVWLGIGYSFAEAILFALMVVFATRTEIMRKARLAQAQERWERQQAAAAQNTPWAEDEPQDER